MDNIVNTFDSLYDEDGNLYNGRFMLTVETKNIKEDGSFNTMSIGNMANAITPALSFIIDENTYNQIDKLNIKIINFTPRLVVKEGETFEELVKTETPEEKKIRELEEQLAAYKAKQGVK